MCKFLVYLDQSYLSTMAKETTGQTRAEHARLGTAMGRLLEVLRVLVDQDKVLCPSSTVHDQETGLDSRIADKAHHLLNELSDRVRFYPYPEIELAQTNRALCRYLGIQTEPEDFRWQHAYRRDPHVPVRRPRVYVHIPPPAEFAEDDRRRKRVVHDLLQRQYEQRNKTRLSTFAEQRTRQIWTSARLDYLDPFVEYVTRAVAVHMGVQPPPTIEIGSPVQEFIGYMDLVTPPHGVTLFLQYLKLTGHKGPLPDERFRNFFISPEFDSIPFYDIFCSMQAGFLYYRPDRKPKASDPYDLVALASVLPYVDIVTTDSSMKDMLKQTGLDNKYGVEVYSARQSHVEALTKRLSLLA